MPTDRSGLRAYRERRRGIARSCVGEQAKTEFCFIGSHEQLIIAIEAASQLTRSTRFSLILEVGPEPSNGGWPRPYRDLFVERVQHNASTSR